MSSGSGGRFARLRDRFNSKGLFFRNVATLLSGAFASRVIAVIAIPFLARLYTPAEFGILALFLTVNAIIASIATCRYDMAMMLPEKDVDSYRLMVASICIACAFSVLAAVLFWLYGDEIAGALGAPVLADWLWLNPLVLLAVSSYNSLRSWAARKNHFAGIGKAYVAYTLSTVSVQFLLAFVQRLGSGGLIIGTTIGQLVQTYALWRTCRKSLRETHALRRQQGSSISKLLYRYRRFAIFDTGANFLNSSSRELPVLMLGIFFSPVVVGFYAVGQRMLATPVQMISNATSQVFFPRAREDLAAGKLDQLARKLFAQLTVLGVTPFLLLAVAVPEVVTVFLGENWTEAIPYIRWLSVWLLAIFIASPFNQLFSVLEKQRERLNYVSVLMVLQVVSLGLGGWLQDPVLAVALFSAVSGSMVMLNCVWLMYKAGVAVASVTALLARQFLLALPFVLLLLAARWLLDGDFIRLVMAALVLLAFVALRFNEVSGRRRL